MSCRSGEQSSAVRTASELLAPLGEQVVPGGPLGSLTTYRVGGRAAVLVTVASEQDLALVEAAVRASGLPVLVVGRGSNLLVADAGFGGIAVLLDPAGFGAVTIEGAVVRAGGAVPLPALARQTRRRRPDRPGVGRRRARLGRRRGAHERGRATVPTSPIASAPAGSSTSAPTGPPAPSR